MGKVCTDILIYICTVLLPPDPQKHTHTDQTLIFVTLHLRFVPTVSFDCPGLSHHSRWETRRSEFYLRRIQILMKYGFKLQFRSLSCLDQDDINYISEWLTSFLFHGVQVATDLNCLMSVIIIMSPSRRLWQFC